MVHSLPGPNCAPGRRAGSDVLKPSKWFETVTTLRVKLEGSKSLRIQSPHFSSFRPVPGDGDWGPGPTQHWQPATDKTWTMYFLPSMARVWVNIKAGFRSRGSYNTTTALSVTVCQCFGTASQGTPQLGKGTTRASMQTHLAVRVGFELAINGIQFYVFAN